MRRLPQALLLLAATACSAERDPVDRAAGPPTHVGRATCARCHQEQAKRWHGSHHDLAMQEVSEDTVLGDFDDAEFRYAGVTSRMFRRGAEFWVETDGPDGTMQEYRVEYVFGVDPLQQYLIALSGGRLQALGICWDARPVTAGGQRWFHLHPDEKVDHRDPLHWTRATQNWNHTCAACHSTNLRKNYDAATHTYDTRWDEIDVSCEACHGPGSTHVAWAEAGRATGDPGLVVDLGNDATWSLAPGAVTAHRVPPRGVTDRAEVETCAPCHSRRTLLHEAPAGQPFLDNHLPALLDEGLYHADGQILDEVYVWGSFVQSKMYHAGVTCSDCHDPHSQRLHAAGNALCTRCHQAAVFDAPSHHHHEPGTASAACVECHMPAKTYMVVDPRRDHSLRVPRPDLTATVGAPNACNNCHAEEGAQWAADAIATWRGEGAAPPPEHYGTTLRAGRQRAAHAGTALAALAGDGTRPAIVRATALALLAEQPAPLDLPTLLNDPADLIRYGGLRALQNAPPGALLETALPLLQDRVRAVRTEAARLLARVPPDQLPTEHRAAFDRGIEELIAGLTLNGDQPFAQVNLGTLHADLGQNDDAARAYSRALQLDPDHLRAYINLAQLHKTRGRDDLGEPLLRAGLGRHPNDPLLQHTLGLLLVRQKRTPEALELLQRAAALRPQEPRFSYVYGVALHSTGAVERGLQVLARAHERHPTDLDILGALFSYHQQARNRDEALRYAEKLNELVPGNPQLEAQVRALRQAVKR